MERLFVSLLLCAFVVFHCVSGHQTKQIEITEGPRLNKGRMSATLASIKRPNGNIYVIGGAPSEQNFVPHTGTNAIEVLRPPYTKWEFSNISVPYPLAGNAYILPDGRVLVYASIFAFNPKSTRTEVGQDPNNPNAPDAGPVSAVIIDLDAGSVTPIYRPKDNTPCGAPLKGSLGLVQRAFAKSIQLKDGTILRLGSFGYYVDPNPTAKCEESKCVYCLDGTCKADENFQYGCHEVKDCPNKEGTWHLQVGDMIEIYTPPTNKQSLGTVKCIKMDAGRTSLDAIQLQDGRVLITGGWGPEGDGVNQSYGTTYFLDSKTATLTPGPRMLEPREDHSTAMLEDGRILVTGGTVGSGKTVKSTEIFSPQKGIFEYGDDMQFSREDHFSMYLGPLIMFVGGEVADKADQIRNTAAFFNRKTGAYISPQFLYSRPENGALEAGLAGISDGAGVHLDDNTILLFGGQQGYQDRDGEYISAGIGTIRTLLVKYNP